MRTSGGCWIRGGGPKWHLELQATSDISGEIQTRRVRVEDGAVVQGQAAERRSMKSIEGELHGDDNPWSRRGTARTSGARVSRGFPKRLTFTPK